MGFEAGHGHPRGEWDKDRLGQVDGKTIGQPQEWVDAQGICRVPRPLRPRAGAALRHPVTRPLDRRVRGPRKSIEQHDTTTVRDLFGSSTVDVNECVSSQCLNDGDRRYAIRRKVHSRTGHPLEAAGAVGRDPKVQKCDSAVRTVIVHAGTAVRLGHPDIFQGVRPATNHGLGDPIPPTASPTFRPLDPESAYRGVRCSRKGGRRQSSGPEWPISGGGAGNLDFPYATSWNSRFSRLYPSS